MCKSKFLLLLIIIPFFCQAQFFQFSQFNFTDQRVNPAFGTLSRYRSIDIIYRQQNTAENFNINSAFASINMPIKFKNAPNSAFGVSFLDDRAGDAGIYRSNDVGVNYSSSVRLSRQQEIGFGISLNWKNRSIDLNGLSTGMQFIEDRGFGFGDNGETLGRLNTNSFGWNSGISWRKYDRNSNLIASWSLAVFDLNRPDESFFGSENRLPRTVVASGGFRLYQGLKFSLDPDFLVSISGSRIVSYLGGSITYNSDSEDHALAFLTRYSTSGYGILGLQLYRNKLKFGVSYDFAISQQVANNSAFEFAIGLRELVEEKARNKKIRNKKVRLSRYARKRKKYVRKTRKRKLTETKIVKKSNGLDELPAKETVHNGEVDSTRHVSTETTNDNTVKESEYTGAEGKAEVGKLNHQPFFAEIVKYDFSYGFNSHSLSEHNRNILQDLIEVLSQDQNLQLKIIGHTDDIGSEEFNLRLSEQRALSVSKFLKKNGIQAERIMISGKGESEPIMDNTTAEGRAKNRRVELIVNY